MRARIYTSSSHERIVLPPFTTPFVFTWKGQRYRAEDRVVSVRRGQQWITSRTLTTTWQKAEAA